ncbi:MAG: methyltransferase domain-containing protein [Hyphomicrobiales bacterium]|nr:methyltransferase domain-containing protein [Hyphomicrobiales bacterium]
MAGVVATAVHATGQALRLGVYYGAARLLARQLPAPPTAPAASGAAPRETASRPTAGLREMVADIAGLLREDAAGVRAGIYPPMADEPALLDWVSRMRAMFADAPAAFARRTTRDATTAETADPAAALPDYYRQDFHFQTGGYLTDDSARLYDAQVETLFMGSAELMRRAALRELLDALAGRDQRRVQVADIACGTGRLLRQMRLAMPAATLSGVDLSRAYLDEARRHLGNLRPVAWLEGNAEGLPFADASLDAATCVYLFHELPPVVRQTVARELARVLKPGGTLVFMNSLQLGDRPDYDRILEQFPVRFHEPYYRNYIIDDLDDVFSAAGLEARSHRHAFLSKVMVRQKRA